MKKYKIIKTYPGSDKLGTVITLDKNGECWSTPQLVIESDCKNNPEFFEEIIQKDYEILSFKGNLKTNQGYFVKKWGNLYTFIDLNGVKVWENADTSAIEGECLLEGNTSSIYSIKRLSDSEVFSIGDAVQSIRSNWQGNDCKIERIHAREDGSIDFTINQGNTQGTYKNCLDNFRKAKPVLFVTEDGVEIFEGDDFVAVNKKEIRISGHNLNTKNISLKSRVWDGSDGYLQFSSVEKAQEWVILNKPMLSIKDIQPIIGKNLEYRNGGSYLDLDKLTEKFKELVQSKL